MSASTEPTVLASNAFKVGIAFVKQYYKTLSSQPDLLPKFYAPNDAYLSHGEGSDATEPSPPDNIDHKEIWGCSQGETMLFEFDDGAIDAQPSHNEGILLLVTASVIFTIKNSEGQKVERRRQFVQTFFLAKMGRNFAVLNDMLRFLAVPTLPVDVPSKEEVVEEALVVEEEAPVAKVEEDKKEESVAPTEGSVSAESDASAPGGGVEETKEEAPEEEEVSAPKEKKRSSSKEGKGKKNKGGKQQQAKAAAVSKPTPGSWASLVVSGGSAPNTPSRGAMQEKKASGAAPKSSKQPPLPPSDTTSDGNERSEGTTTTSQDQTTDNSKPAPTTNAVKNNKSKGKENKEQNGNQQQPQKQHMKRDPDNTLVIKNLSDNVKEQDILNMFQPFATATKGKIVGTNINHNRNLAFVDYDSVGPVLAALKKHKETPFEMNGKVLEVDQKTLEQRARRKAAAAGNQNNGFRPKNNNGGRGGDKIQKNDRKRGTRAGR